MSETGCELGTRSAEGGLPGDAHASRHGSQPLAAAGGGGGLTGWVPAGTGPHKRENAADGSHRPEVTLES